MITSTSPLCSPSDDHGVYLMFCAKSLSHLYRTVLYLITFEAVGLTIATAPPSEEWTSKPPNVCLALSLPTDFHMSLASCIVHWEVLKKLSSSSHRLQRHRQTVEVSIGSLLNLPPLTVRHGQEAPPPPQMPWCRRHVCQFHVFAAPPTTGKARCGHALIMEETDYITSTLAAV